MKNYILSILTLVFFAAANVTNAQINTPAASPSAKVMQTVGLTDITVEYSRPSMKDRTIFAADGLVPYGDVWRTGANAVTKFSTTDDIKVGGKMLKAGDYAILTIPNPTSWMVHFYPYESGSWGSYIEKNPMVAISAKSMKVGEKIESFMILFDELTNDSANMYIMWENTMVPVAINAMVDDRVMADITSTLAGPTKGDYYSAASYYFDSGKDLNKALEYINMATDGPDQKFWQLRKKSLILAKLGKKSDAIAAAKTSLALAKEAGNNDYIRMNEASIKEWSM